MLRLSSKENIEGDVLRFSFHCVVWKMRLAVASIEAVWLPYIYSCGTVNHITKEVTACSDSKKRQLNGLISKNQMKMVSYTGILHICETIVYLKFSPTRDKLEKPSIAAYVFQCYFICSGFL